MKATNILFALLAVFFITSCNVTRNTYNKRWATKNKEAFYTTTKQLLTLQPQDDAGVLCYKRKGNDNKEVKQLMRRLHAKKITLYLNYDLAENNRVYKGATLMDTVVLFTANEYYPFSDREELFVLLSNDTANTTLKQVCPNCKFYTNTIAKRKTPLGELMADRFFESRFMDWFTESLGYH